MKKLLLTTALAVCTLAAYGQGTINFNNATSTYGSATPSHLITFGPTASLYAAGLANGGLVSSNYASVNLGNLRALLYYGASTQNSIAGLTAATGAASTFRGSTSAQAGAWIAPNAGALTLVGFDVGATINAAVLVWDSSAYASGAAAYAAFATGNWNGLFGHSGIFQYTVPPVGSPPSAYFMANQGAFTLAAVPEPSTFALAGLGAAALMIFRRRK
jgi:PEP-CTERM motif-containing protein